MVALAACTPGGVESHTATPTIVGDPSPAAQPTPTRTPYAPTGQPAAVDTTDVRMPLALEEAAVVDPGWTAMPQELGGILLGAAELHGLVEFTAIRVDGEALWTVQRALGAGFALTRTSQGDPLAVITDTPDVSSEVTATAYRLDTGEPVWGPVDVPGPLVGPGAVFSAAHADDAGATVALSPDTGAALTWAGEGNARVLGEFEGEVLVETHGRLALRNAHDDTERWSVTDPAWNGTVTVAPDTDQRDGLLIVEDAEGTRALIRRETGQVIAQGLIDAVIDTTTSTIVATYSDGSRAIDLDGGPLWANPAGGNAVLHSARGALVYTRDGATMRVHNIVTGAVAVAYEDDGRVIAVPERFFTTGAAVIAVDGTLLLATSPY
jgi:hypothetical protein